MGAIAQQIYEDSIKTLNCKTTASAYGVFDDNEKLISLNSRPNICGVPYCEKCERERQGRLMKTYKPYFDAHKSPFIRHIICTVPVVKRSELEGFINPFLDNIKRFHEELRKNLKYPFTAISFIEPHYQPETDTYNCHVHYGVFSLVNIKSLRDSWCKVMHDGSLVVKYPQKNGKTIFRTRKYAFLEYVTRRRTQQARKVPLSDYYGCLRSRQLIKRIGFSKVYLAMVTTIRKAQQVLPDTQVEIFLANYDSRLKFERLEAEFRRRWALIGPERDDTVSFKSHVRRIFREIVESMPYRPAQQVSLNTYWPKELNNGPNGNIKVLCTNSNRILPSR